MNKQFAIIILLLAPALCTAQSGGREKSFTRADTLRGSITPGRSWWNVLRYDINVEPDYVAKTTVGSNLITYKVTGNNQSSGMQVDLQPPLHIDSVLFNKTVPLSFTQDGNAWHIKTDKQKNGAVNSIEVFFSGNPHESTRPPWSGGWTFAKDTLGRPWMTVTCQGLGASIWYPCKDHQSDEPDKGASLTITVPDTLVAVANGHIQYRKDNKDGTSTYKWSVVNPINNYCIIPYIGKYVHFADTYNGEKGKLEMDYWVLDYNLEKAKGYLTKEANNMLKAFEHWFGPYPFYEDGYKLVDAPHTGMEHQSAIAYGNWYQPGYRLKDGSGTGWGLKWDFIVVHESGHEWFGNNITSNDLADMYIHEGFTNYSETLFVEYFFGVDAGNAYNAGTRRGIRNDRPIIAGYNVNDQGSGDMYPKAGNMIHTIRHSIDNDALFRQILRGLNKTFYHKTVNTPDVVNYISKMAGYNYSKVFDQYLTTIDIPELEYYFSNDNKKVFYRWLKALPGFNLPLVLKGNDARLKITPTAGWQTVTLKDKQRLLFDADAIKKKYYINTSFRKRKAD